ncbi:MAG: hypothetical protein JW807_17330 [Spirochaetes bacterium]|nr:hypothetical protein [Spirochaetota bacterium]
MMPIKLRYILSFITTFAVCFVLAGCELISDDSRRNIPIMQALALPDDAALGLDIPMESDAEPVYESAPSTEPEAEPEPDPAPVLNTLSIEAHDAASVTLARPTFENPGDPEPSVTAYIGEAFLMNVEGDTVSNYIEGPVDVSGGNYRFAGLDPGKDYSIIVVAKNISGSSVRRYQHSLGSANAVAADAARLMNTPPESFLTGDDIDPERVTQSLSLPASGANGTAITWSSSDPEAISDYGAVTRFMTSVTVTLTATVEKEGETDDSASFTFTVYRVLFYDGFEDGDLGGWTENDPYNKFEAGAVTTYAAGGSYSLAVTGFDGWGPEMFFADITPEYIGYYIMVSTTNLETGSVAFFDGSDQITCISFAGDGTITVPAGGSAYNRYDVYSKNDWYLVELKNIDWAARTYDLYINDEMKDENLAFRSRAEKLTRLILFNWDNSISWWDDILIY